MNCHLHSDYDLAYSLQLREAMAASRRHAPAVAVDLRCPVADGAVVVASVAADRASSSAMAANQPQNATMVTASASARRLSPADLVSSGASAVDLHGPVLECAVFDFASSSTAAATQPATSAVSRLSDSAARRCATGTDSTRAARQVIGKIATRAVPVGSAAAARASFAAAAAAATKAANATIITASAADRNATRIVANSLVLRVSSSATAATQPASAVSRPTAYAAAFHDTGMVVTRAVPNATGTIPTRARTGFVAPAAATRASSSATATAQPANATVTSVASSNAGRQATAAVAARASLAASLPPLRALYGPRRPTLSTAAAIRAAVDATASAAPQPSNTIIIGHTIITNDAAEYTNCAICMSSVSTYTTLSIHSCLHRFCFPCITKHVEARLLDHPGPPRCPHHGCTTVLKPSYFNGVLSPNLLRMMEERLSEATIAEGDKVYCPYPACSALMSKSSMKRKRKAKPYGNDPKSKVRCIKCNRSLCLDCKGACPAGTVHSCGDDEKNNPLLSTELKELVKQKNWRRCGKCHHMIELLHGCFHVTCRCGHEFCYKCGAPRISKTQAGCSCLLWNEANIIFDPATIFGQ